MNFIIKLIATGGGAGYFPIAQGTAGALLALILYWILPLPSVPLFVLLVLLLLGVGIYAATVVEKEVVTRLGAAAGKDPSIIVIDEIVGMLVALIALPKTMKVGIIAFVLFRIFDIVKPFPARRSERLVGGWGIMMDDVVAGIYANLITHLYLWML